MLLIGAACCASLLLPGGAVALSLCSCTFPLHSMAQKAPVPLPPRRESAGSAPPTQGTERPLPRITVPSHPCFLQKAECRGMLRPTDA